MGSGFSRPISCGAKASLSTDGAFRTVYYLTVGRVSAVIQQVRRKPQSHSTYDLENTRPSILVGGLFFLQWVGCMKKLILLCFLVFCSMPVFADNWVLVAYDNNFYSNQADPSIIGAGKVTGISDIYYYYDQASKTLKAVQTEWLSTGGVPPYEEPSSYESTLYYHEVTFGNMCQILAEYCNDSVKQQIQEYINRSSGNKSVTERLANEYTDNQINRLRKKLSSGIASVAAMSSIVASDVDKGEVSVGAGYGHYNGQSAVAFGATIGITEKWSANAAAGLADSNVSFRAGTNYKFKLF